MTAIDPSALTAVTGTGPTGVLHPGTPRTALRAAAASALLCTALHLVLLVVGGADHLGTTAPMALLATACAGCALHLWRGHATRVDVAVMAALASAMVALHLLMHHPAQGTGTPGLSTAAASMPGMAHTGGALSAHGSVLLDRGMQVGVVLSVTQLALLGVGLVVARLTVARAR